MYKCTKAVFLNLVDVLRPPPLRAGLALFARSKPRAVYSVAMYRDNLKSPVDNPEITAISGGV